MFVLVFILYILDVNSRVSFEKAMQLDVRIRWCMHKKKKKKYTLGLKGQMTK